MASDKIFVDLDEEIVFTVEKILNSAAARVIVVIPESANLVASMVSLKLLSRQISRSNKLIVVVTEDQLGLKLSKEAGLLAVSKISQITPNTWIEVEKLKKDFLEARKALRDRLIGDRNEKTDYAIVDEAPIVEETVETNDEEDIKSEKVTEEEIEYAPAFAPKPRLDPKVVNLGNIKVLAGGDIEANSDFADELMGIKNPKEKSIKEIAKGTSQNAVEKTIQKDSEVLDEEDQEVQKPQKQQRRTEIIGRDMASLVPGRPVKRSRFNPQKTSTFSAPKINLSSNQYIQKIKDFYQTGNTKVKLLITAVVVIGMIVFLSSTVFSGAKVELYIAKANVAVSQAEVTAKVGIRDLDTEEMVVGIRPITLEDNASNSADTTGIKQDGNKAKGIVTFYNKTEKEVNLTAGAVIENINNGLKYKLTAPAKIPAAIVDGGGNVNVGVQKDIPVEAESFGEKYNTGASATYKVAGYTTDELSAKSFNDLTGGTTSDEKAVSQGDIDDLKAGLTAELQNSLKLKLAQQLSNDEVLIEGSTTYKEVSSDSDKKVGDVATSLTVSLKLEATAYVVKTDDLKKLAAAAIKKNSDFSGEVDIEKLKIPKISDVVKDSDTVTFKIETQGDITADIKKDELQKQLTGKSLKETKNYIESLDGVEKYEVNIKPFFVPSSLKKMPKEQKIEIKIFTVEKK